MVRKQYFFGCIVSVLFLFFSISHNGVLSDSANMIVNGDFSEKTYKWGLTTQSGGKAAFSVEKGELHVIITKGGDFNWSILVTQPRINIEKGKTYSVSFRARCKSGNRNLSVKAGLAREPWTLYSEYESFMITTKKTNYSFTFVMSEPTDKYAHCEFQLGKSDIDVYIDDVTFTKISNGSNEEEETGEILFDDFDNYNPSTWIKHEVLSHSISYCTFRPGQVDFLSDGTVKVVTLRLDVDPDYNDTSDRPYKSGELRSADYYGYGLYEVRMKPVIHTGVVSSFFVMTGPWDGPGTPWDEIDIEFILDPNKGNPNPVMQCNYFHNGVGNHEYKVDLAFDATKEYHTYAFQWEPENITWFIDGVEVHSATENIPACAGRIMMNLYPPDPEWEGTEEWTGHFDGEVPLVAYYDRVRYTPWTHIENILPGFTIILIWILM